MGLKYNEEGIESCGIEPDLFVGHFFLGFFMDQCVEGFLVLVESLACLLCRETNRWRRKLMMESTYLWPN